MRELIDNQSVFAIKHYGDATGAEFYKRLKEKRLCSTRCEACREIAFPPRPFCPYCHSRKVSWVDLPKRAKLYAFTQQKRALRFSKPDVIGLVEVEGVGHFMTRIDAPFESLAIGQELELSFLEVTPELWVHQYRPVAAPA